MRNHRVACITGSGRKRVGRSVAEALAQRGYHVALHYHTAAAEAAEAVQELTRRGVSAAAFAADLTQESEVAALFDRIVTQFGRIDVLVHCAAIWSPQRLESTTAADVRRFFDVNALSTFLCAQQAGLRMVEQPDGGCIITVGDWATARPYLHHTAYFMSKAVIPTLTRTLAVELGHRNPAVRVNCVLPGPVMMPSTMPESERQGVVAATLVQREGTPDHVAQAAVALIENDFITGACLPVDGGRTIFSGQAE